MEKTKNIIILVLLIILAIFVETRKEEPAKPNVVIRKEYDSIPWVFQAKNPAPETKTLIKYIRVKEKTKIDSEAIYKAYISKVKYAQVLKNDSIAYIKLDQVISQNRVISQHLVYVPKRPTLYSETIIKNKTPAIRILTGVSVMGGIQKMYIFGELGLLTRKDDLFRIGYDPFQRLFEAGVLFKIHFRRKQPP